eukprot:5633104-Amphidinium_carterae.2
MHLVDSIASVQAPRQAASQRPTSVKDVKRECELHAITKPSFGSCGPDSSRDQISVFLTALIASF